jgi:hypothetical protein
MAVKYLRKRPYCLQSLKYLLPALYRKSFPTSNLSSVLKKRKPDSLSKGQRTNCHIATEEILQDVSRLSG